MGRSFERVNATERKLILRAKKAGLTLAEIQGITERSSKTIDTVLKEAKTQPSTGVKAATKQFAANLTKKNNKNNKKTLLSVLDNPQLPARGSLTLANFKALVLALDKLQEKDQRAKGSHYGHGEGDGPRHRRRAGAP